MEKTKCIFIFYASFFTFLMIGTKVNASCDGSKKQGEYFNGISRKLFVFGDSYADTGNLGKLGRSLTRSWYEPYGMTYPNRPTGRFSNGKVFPDFIASFLGIKSPIPYKYRRIGPKVLPYGMNFAVGGSGVFDTGNFQRNLSAQVDALQAQIDERVYSVRDLKSSIALVVISGNDYSYYMNNGGSFDGIWDFIRNVTAQLKLDLKRIHEIGVGKVVVTTLAPLGCTPYLARDNNYTHCQEIYDLAVQHHNDLLLKAVNDLRREELKEGITSSAYQILDLYSPFMAIINQEKGAAKFKHILKPCCEGKESKTNCGEINDKGVKQYSVCSNPEEYFYWDSIHPSQAGWAAVFHAIRPWLIRHL